MALTVGSRLGHHDVTALIGKGGMGEMYRARDTKLDRDVALKVSPQAFTEDPDRLARFERGTARIKLEIQTGQRVLLLCHAEPLILAGPWDKDRLALV